MDYEYDLVSGKVNFMYYQKGKDDQFIHKYEYDGDNRITQVYTSRDGVTWDRDAKYDYYAHGPLAKTTIGNNSVETCTYAYTIQGWIKGVNGNEFSYALGYFDDGTHSDYQGIGGAGNYTLATPVATGRSLYNGNIATMSSNTPQFATQDGANWVQQYEYDQLNRIKQSTTFGAANANAHKTSYAYDAGGNITELNRHDAAGNQFDAMTYNYHNTDSGYKHNTNKLRWVDDTEPVAVHTTDIDDQQAENYKYDDIGNLIADVSEGIEKIQWTVYGKVKSVKRTTASTKPELEFAYDATGNRVVKIVKHKTGGQDITYYLRDASGNVLSIYKSANGGAPILEEQYIYGSSRLGTYIPPVTPSAGGTLNVPTNNWNNSTGNTNGN